MSEERAKILKLLKEGRITVEEAALLLDALEEGTRSAEGGSSGADQSRVGGERGGRSREERHGEGFERERGHERNRGAQDWWGSQDWGRFAEWSRAQPWRDFDFSRFQTGFEGAFRGMEQTIRDTFKNFSNLNFDAELGRMFGRERGQVERTIAVPTGGLTRLCLRNAWGDVSAVAAEVEEIRIEAIPYALMCIECQTSDERRNR